MKREDISRAVGDIDTAYIEEAAEEPPKKNHGGPWGKRVLAAAACAALICTAVRYLPRPVSTEPPGNGGSPADSPVPCQEENAPLRADEADAVQESETLCREFRFNDARLLAVSGDIELSGGDFVPMSREALLAYFNTALPVPQALPELRPRSPESGDYGLYRGADGEICRDGNVFPFADGDGGRRVDIVLSKTGCHAGAAPELTEDGDLSFTPVNGRDLAVFRDGGTLYVEWMQSGVGWRVRAEGLTDTEFVQLLAVLVKPVEPAPEHTLTGSIQVLDPHALWVAAEDGTGGVRVELPPDFSMDTLQHGDRAAVTWRGECATLQTVWAEQLVTFTPL